MKKALILTVGTGTRKDTNMVDPLRKAVEACNPNFTVLIATQKSKSIASQVAEECGFSKKEFRIVRLRNENDLEQTSLQIERAIDSVQAKGYGPREIDVDFTSGTKPMSAAAALSAIRRGCGTLRYISGDRTDGVVMSGREKPLLFPTDSILAQKQLDLANSFLKQLQFQAAKQIIDNIKNILASDEDKKLAEDLSGIAVAYDCWDKFDHQGFLHDHKRLKFKYPPTKPYRVGKRTLQLLKELIGNVRKNIYSFLAVADLLNNAERRAYEGKFDDAVARTYRAVEMLGQYRLQERYGIDASRVDLMKISVKERESLHLDPTGKEPPKVALVQVFRLLAGRNDKIGLAYVNNSKLQSLLGARNYSILAHGIQPVKEKEYKDLFREVLNLCREQDKRIDKIRKTLQFPWLVQVLTG